MVRSCAQNITSFLIYNKAIKEDENELYVYGFETLIAFIINIIAILIIGTIFNKFIHTLLFTLCYCPIKQFSGGYHAESYKKCFLSFLSLYLINITVLNIFMYRVSNIAVIIITILCAIGTIILSPLEHRNNPLSIKEKKRYKDTVKFLVSIALIFVVVGLRNKNIYEYACFVSASICWIFIMLNLAILKKIGAFKNEKII